MQLSSICVRLIFGFLLATLLAACGPVKEKPVIIPPVDPDIARAQTLFDQQDYLSAAQLYRSLAAKNPGASSIDYLLSAADASLAGDDISATSGLLEQLKLLPMNSRQTLQAHLIEAELMLKQQQAAQALARLLQTVPAQGQPLALNRRYHRDLADAYRQLGNTLDSVKALQTLDGLQSDPLQKLETQTEILQSLTSLNELVLSNLQPSPPGVLGGWMELARLIKRHGADPQTLQPLLQQWRTQLALHPALPALLSSYQERLQAQIQRAAHIAVLLPQTGPFTQVAQALRDGIMASYFKLAADKRPILQFYDSADTSKTWPIYSQAVNDGAEMVIGPLQKEAVAQLSRAGDLPAPVLALNQIQPQSIPPINFFMFSLSPEDEARQAAERIWLDGYRQPAILIPEGDWGQRVVRAFDNRWLALSGRAADFRTYDDSSSDYSQAITGLLHLDQSEQRHKTLQRWLGQKLEFEPRRRADSDAIFLAALPGQAQSFAPQLQFHRAADLPIYATSHAWTGTLNAQQLADMKGMILADVPLLVLDQPRRDLSQNLPGMAGPLVRLYAMGMDALDLIPHLRRLQSSTFESLDGQTGNLFIDPENRILRQTVWIELANPPKILGYAARLDLNQFSMDESPLSTEPPSPAPVSEVTQSPPNS